VNAVTNFPVSSNAGNSRLVAEVLGSQEGNYSMGLICLIR
jgi:hypothetical protein